MENPREQLLSEGNPLEDKRRRDRLHRHKIAEMDISSDPNMPVCGIFRFVIQHNLRRQKQSYRIYIPTVLSSEEISRRFYAFRSRGNRIRLAL